MSESTIQGGIITPAQSPSTVEPGSESEALLQQDGIEEQEPVAAPEARARIKSLKLKVYGEEVEENLPFEIDDSPEAVEYLTKQLQLSKAAQRAMQENTSFQKQVQAFFQNLKGNTRQTLQDMGIDPKEFAAAVIEEEIEKSQLSPEQREKQELQAKLKKMEDDRREEKEEWNKTELERLQQREYEKIDVEMSQALSNTDLPKSPYVIKKMAQYMLMGLDAGVDITPADIIPLVREEIVSDLQAMFAAMPEDAVEAVIGRDVFNRVRKKNLSKVKGPTPGAEKAKVRDVTGNTKEANTKKDAPKQSFKDFFGV